MAGNATISTFGKFHHYPNVQLNGAVTEKECAILYDSRPHIRGTHNDIDYWLDCFGGMNRAINFQHVTSKSAMGQYVME